MSNNNIDNLFKKALQEQGCEPPEYIWKNIENNLYKRKQLHTTWWFRGLSAAAFIALFIGLAQLIRLESDTDTMFNIIEVAEVDLSGNSVKSDIKKMEYIDDKTPRTISVQKQISQKNIFPKALPIRKILPSVATPKKQLIVAIKSSTPIASLKSSPVHIGFIPITSKEALKNNEKYLALQNTETSNKKENKKIKMALSGHLTPTYSSGNYSSSVTNTRGDSYSGEQMDGLMNIGGGLKLAVHINKRLSFQTGLSYSRMGQTHTESNEAPYVTAFSVASKNNRVATFLGNIRSRRKASAYNELSPDFSNNLAVNTDESLEQVFNTLSIPLYVSYRLNNNKVLFSILGGLSGDFIVNNKVYLETEGERELIGSTDNIRTFNISTDLGLGVTYPISNKIKIMVEPGFKYYLQSISSDKRIDFKPYAFTFSTGIGFEF